MVRIEIVLLFVALAVPSILAQDVQPEQVEIKGSANPELIPERDAYWMLFMHMADGPRSLSRGARIRFLRPSGLSDVQIEAVLSAATEYQAASTAIRAGLKDFLKAHPERPMPAAVRAEFDSVAARELAALESALGRMRSSLDAEARWRLKKFVNTTVKATMTMTKPK
jgi:hypothetical protein